MYEYYYELEFYEGYQAGKNGLPLKDCASWVYEEGYNKAIDEIILNS